MKLRMKSSMPIIGLRLFLPWCPPLNYSTSFTGTAKSLSDEIAVGIFSRRIRRERSDKESTKSMVEVAVEDLKRKQAEFNAYLEREQMLKQRGGKQSEG